MTIRLSFFHNDIFIFGLFDSNEIRFILTLTRKKKDQTISRCISLTLFCHDLAKYFEYSFWDCPIQRFCSKTRAKTFDSHSCTTADGSGDRLNIVFCFDILISYRSLPFRGKAPYSLDDWHSTSWYILVSRFL